MTQINQITQVEQNESLNASVLSTGDFGSGVAHTRICEYCEVKLDNPQIDKYYEMGKLWRNRENDLLERKLEWYEEAVEDLDVNLKRESTSLTVAEMDYYTQKETMKRKLENIISDKNRIDSFKRQLGSQVQQRLIENQDLDQKLDLLKNDRTEKLLELDKVMALFESKEKERIELIKKTQVLQGLGGDEQVETGGFHDEDIEASPSNEQNTRNQIILKNPDVGQESPYL